MVSLASETSPLASWMAASGRAASMSPWMPVEQLLGLLEPPLPDPQVGQPGERAATQVALTESPEPDGFGQRDVRLGPPTRRRQQPAVVRAAERRDRREPPSLGDRLTDADPLVRARDVVRALTRREELAEDLLQDTEVVDLTARHCRKRFVEQQHALFGPVGVDEARSEVGQRVELQVGVAEAASYLERLTEEDLLAGAVTLEHAALERHPPAFARLPVPQQRRRAGQPPAHDRGVAEDHAVHVRERPCNAHRAEQVAGVAMGGVRSLPFLDGLRVVALEIGRAGQPLDHITRCWFGRCALEDDPRGRCIAATQRGATLGDELWDLCGHSRIIARAEAGLAASLGLVRWQRWDRRPRSGSGERGQISALASPNSATARDLWPAD